MKQLLFLFAFALAFSGCIAQGTTTIYGPLIVKKTIQGGAYTTAQLPDSSKCVRCIVYNTDSNRYAFSTGFSWIYFGGGGGSSTTLPFSSITGNPLSNTNLANVLNQKVNYTDTASMLAAYIRSALAVKYSDTGNMLLPYLRANLGVKYTDTGSMLSPYLRSALFTKSGIGLGAVANSLQVINAGGMVSIGAGAFGSIPSASTGPTMWWATDTLAWYYSNGSSYQKMQGGSGGGGGTSADSSIFLTRYRAGITYVPLTSFNLSGISTAIGYTPYSAANPNGYISGNQSIALTLTGDATGTATGTTSLSAPVTINKILGSTVPTLSNGLLRYTSGTGFAWDATGYYKPTDTVSTLVTQWGLSQYNGFIKTETDPVANAKTITVNRTRGISITQSAGQTLGSSPSWTISPDTTVLEPVSDVANFLRIYDSRTVNPGTIPSGAGSRFEYVPSLSAIRVGTVSGTQWDSANIGLYSAAFGSSNLVSAQYGFAAGWNNVVTGQASSAMGIGNLVTGYNSVAYGNGDTITSQPGIAWGAFNRVDGNYGVALGGFNHIANQYGIAMGSQLSVHYPFQTFTGKLNDSTNAALVFGIGWGNANSGIRKNVFTVDTLGDVIGNAPANSDSSNQLVPSAWVAKNFARIGTYGVTRVGPLDSLTGVAKGAQVVGQTLLMQSASASNAGLELTSHFLEVDSIIKRTFKSKIKLAHPGGGYWSAYPSTAGDTLYAKNLQGPVNSGIVITPQADSSLAFSADFTVLAGLTNTQTLTNKTLTAPILTNPQLGTTSTLNYVWTATDALGHGSWQVAQGGTGNQTLSQVLTTLGDTMKISNGNSIFLPAATHSLAGMFSAAESKRLDSTVTVVNSGHGLPVVHATYTLDTLKVRGIYMTGSNGISATYTGNTDSISFNMAFTLLQSQGDLAYQSASGLSRLPIGPNGTVLTVVNQLPVWQAISGTGTVTNFSSTPSVGTLFTTSVATASTTPVQTITLNSACSQCYFGDSAGTGVAAYHRLNLLSAEFGKAGTTTQVLHGNPTGAFTFGAVNLPTDVTGVLNASNAPPLTGAVTSTGGTGITAIANGAVGTAQIAAQAVNLQTQVSQVLPQGFGGTGVANSGVIYLGDTIRFPQLNNVTINSTGTTNVTLPQTGTLLATTGIGTGLTGITYGVTGTPNQILVNNNSTTAQTGALTLSLPQSIGTANTPTFTNQKLSALTTSGIPYYTAGTGFSIATPSQFPAPTVTVSSGANDSVATVDPATGLLRRTTFYGLLTHNSIGGYFHSAGFAQTNCTGVSVGLNQQSYYLGAFSEDYGYVTCTVTAANTLTQVGVYCGGKSNVFTGSSQAYGTCTAENGSNAAAGWVTSVSGDSSILLNFIPASTGTYTIFYHTSYVN